MTLYTMGTSRNLLFVFACLTLQILSGHKALAIGEPCELRANRQYGTCVHVRQCPELLNLLQSRGQAAAQYILNTVCYPGTQIVCCSNSNSNFIEPRPQPTQAPRPRPQPTQAPRPRPQPTQAARPKPKSNYKPLYYPDCGKSRGDFDRVVNGADAKLGNWPWIAALGYVNDTGTEYSCGGSLISSKHILTAAHCVHNRFDLRVVRLGELDLFSDNDGASPIEIDIRRAIVHPQYKVKTQENDIAILQLEEDVEFTDNIHPICLPILPKLRTDSLERRKPFVAGWGARYFNGAKTAKLQEVQIEIESESNCRAAYSQLTERERRGIIIDNRVLCAGDPIENKGTCQGDSGGSLMLPLQNAFYAIGVVSAGYRCADGGFPGVYTKVTEHLNFITKNMY